MRLPAIANHIYKQSRRPALVWGSVVGLFTWVSAAGYAASYPDVADRLQFARTLGTNVGIRAIFGPARALETVEGFTAWRSSTPFAVLGAVWGLLLATKVLRGDEEEGRADLLYAGPVTRSSGLTHALGGVAAVFLVFFAAVAFWVLSVGVVGGYFSWTAALFFSAVSCAGAALFMPLGALTSQLFATRRAASGVGGAVLAVALLLRAIGESVDGAHWLTWLSPLAWIDKTHALTGSEFAPWGLIIGFAGASLAGAAYFASRRDLGAAVLPSRDTAVARTTLLGSPIGFAVRLSWGTTAAWAFGVGVAAGVFGIVSSSISDALASNRSVNDIFSRLGSELSAKGYVGLTFVMMSAVLGMAGAAFVSAGRKEEAEGRLEWFLATPTARWVWLAGRAAVAAVGLVVIGLSAGVGGWIGAAMSGGQFGFVTMIRAGLNVVAPGIVVLGAGTLAHGVVPRLTSGIAYTAVAWSFLVQMLGSVIDLNHFVLDTSLLHHVAPAPLMDPRWDTAVVMALVGLAGVALGALALQRRDLAYG
jgi:ABC-2 type transport system permease protein